MIDELLQQYWGYTTFRPLQREAIDAVLSGRDSVVVLPTGGGKSLCFQLPALVPPAPDATGRPASSLSLVISPLIALMKDQVDGLVAEGVPAACLHSGQTAAERQAALAQVRSGACRLLYVAPERAVGEGADNFAALVAARGVRYVAVDEAHCISQWGHDFRPEYRQLASLRASLGVPFHAFTATATPRVSADIISELKLRDPLVLVGPFDRANLTYRVRPRTELKAQVRDVVSRHRGEAGIIYCLSRREVEAMAAWLTTEGGVRALPYHAGLPDDVRHRNQDAFLNEDADVMVATVAFGMGIDRPDVRFVLHAGAPRSLEHYQQEAGRAGRDGLPAECVLVSSPADFARWRSLLESSGEWNEQVRLLMRDMERYAGATSCRHRALVEYFGQRLDRVPCGACDWCLNELERVDDPLVLAQKILSAIARTGQRWGVGHITAVLRGEASEQVTTRGHDRLSVFGLLRDLQAVELRNYIDQLTQSGFLERTGDQYPTLQITGAGADLLRGQAECVLFRQPRHERQRIRRRATAAASTGLAEDPSLFDRLRRLRMALARARGVPPYVIFHDATLHELARRRPATLAELLEVPGIGQRKVEVYGAALLEELARDAAARPLPT